MNPSDYLIFVAKNLKKAEEEGDTDEVIRILTVAYEAIGDVIDNLTKGDESNDN